MQKNVNKNYIEPTWPKHAISTTTLSLVATITLANAERPKANYTPVVEISRIHPYAKMDAYRAYLAERRVLVSNKAAERKEKSVAANKPIPTYSHTYKLPAKTTTAESLFAAKMAERHGTE